MLNVNYVDPSGITSSKEAAKLGEKKKYGSLVDRESSRQKKEPNLVRQSLEKKTGGWLASRERATEPDRPEARGDGRGLGVLGYSIPRV